MDYKELEKLEEKFKNSLSNDEVQLLFTEIKNLRKELYESYDIIEANKTTRSYFTNIFSTILYEDVQKNEDWNVEVPSNVAKNVTKVTSGHFTLVESKDYNVEQLENRDGYIFDFSNFMMNRSGLINECGFEMISIHYASWR